MITNTQLAEAFGRNLSIVQRQTEGLSHADSLRQPPFRGNCLNWVLGHLANNRDAILRAFGATPVTGEAAARYKRESEPITSDDPDVLPLEELLRLLIASQEPLAAALSSATPDDLAREWQVGQRATTVGAWVFFLYFHETYHVGQTELLRQLAGADDKII
jgi:uncharacterized damage-inducible protein DinB